MSRRAPDGLSDDEEGSDADGSDASSYYTDASSLLDDDDFGDGDGIGDVLPPVAGVSDDATTQGVASRVSRRLDQDLFRIETESDLSSGGDELEVSEGRKLFDDEEEGEGEEELAMDTFSETSSTAHLTQLDQAVIIRVDDLHLDPDDDDDPHHYDDDDDDTFSSLSMGPGPASTISIGSGSGPSSSTLTTTADGTLHETIRDIFSRSIFHRDTFRTYTSLGQFMDDLTHKLRSALRNSDGISVKKRERGRKGKDDEGNVHVAGSASDGGTSGGTSGTGGLADMDPMLLGSGSATSEEEMEARKRFLARFETIRLFEGLFRESVSCLESLSERTLSRTQELQRYIQTSRRKYRTVLSMAESKLRSISEESKSLEESLSHIGNSLIHTGHVLSNLDEKRTKAKQMIILLRFFNDFRRYETDSEFREVMRASKLRFAIFNDGRKVRRSIAAILQMKHLIVPEVEGIQSCDRGRANLELYEQELKSVLARRFARSLRVKGGSSEGVGGGDRKRDLSLMHRQAQILFLLEAGSAPPGSGMVDTAVTGEKAVRLFVERLFYTFLGVPSNFVFSEEIDLEGRVESPDDELIPDDLVERKGSALRGRLPSPYEVEFTDEDLVMTQGWEEFVPSSKKKRIEATAAAAAAAAEEEEGEASSVRDDSESSDSDEPSIYLETGRRKRRRVDQGDYFDERYDRVQRHADLKRLVKKKEVQLLKEHTRGATPSETLLRFIGLLKDITEASEEEVLTVSRVFGADRVGHVYRSVFHRFFLGAIRPVVEAMLPKDRPRHRPLRTILRAAPPPIDLPTADPFRAVDLVVGDTDGQQEVVEYLDKFMRIVMNCRVFVSGIEEKDHIFHVDITRIKEDYARLFNQRKNQYIDLEIGILHEIALYQIELRRRDPNPLYEYYDELRHPTPTAKKGRRRGRRKRPGAVLKSGSSGVSGLKRIVAASVAALRGDRAEDHMIMDFMAVLHMKKHNVNALKRCDILSPAETREENVVLIFEALIRFCDDYLVNALLSSNTRFVRVTEVGYEPDTAGLLRDIEHVTSAMSLIQRHMDTDVLSRLKMILPLHKCDSMRHRLFHKLEKVIGACLSDLFAKISSYAEFCLLKNYDGEDAPRRSRMGTSPYCTVTIEFLEVQLRLIDNTLFNENRRLFLTRLGNKFFEDLLSYLSTREKISADDDVLVKVALQKDLSRFGEFFERFRSKTLDAKFSSLYQMASVVTVTRENVPGVCDTFLNEYLIPAYRIGRFVRMRADWRDLDFTPDQKRRFMLE